MKEKIPVTKYEHIIFQWQISELKKRFSLWEFEDYRIVSMNIEWHWCIIIFEREYKKFVETDISFVNS